MANRSTGPNGRQKRRAPKRPATNSLSVTHPEILSLALPPSLTPRMGSFEAVEVPDTGLLAASRRSTRAFRTAAREAVEATREAHLTLRIIETLLDLPAVAPALTQELTDRYRAWQELHPHRPPPQPTSLLPLPPSGPTPSTSGPGNGPSSSRISQGRPISGGATATATATATARRGTSLADVIEIVDSDSDDTARRLRPPPPPPKKTKLSKQKGKGKARQTSDDEGDSEEEEEVISAQAAAAAIPAVPLSFPPNDDGLDDRGGDNVVVDDDDRSASDLWGGESSGEDKGADGSDTDLWGGESGDDVDMGDGYLWGVKSETGGEILLFLGNDNDNDNDNSNGGGGGGGGDGNGDVDGDVDGRTVFQTGPMVVFDPAMEGESEETFRLQYPNCSPEPCSDESEDECECYQDTEPEPDSDSDLHDANTWQGYEMPTQDTGTAREEGDEEIQ
ncbi:hypothetical protein CF319_g6154 [Tilletia indica]|nr:hypothetical protein CF319_g6154 [Tilletia indica]